MASEQPGFKEEWPRLQKQLTDISRQALRMAKQGEKEIRKLSRQGKMRLDATALTLKKEHIYHLIGKEYLRAQCPASPTARLKELVEEFRGLEREEKSLSRRLQGRRPAA